MKNVNTISNNIMYSNTKIMQSSVLKTTGLLCGRRSVSSWNITNFSDKGVGGI